MSKGSRKNSPAVPIIPQCKGTSGRKRKGAWKGDYVKQVASPLIKFCACVCVDLLVDCFLLSDVSSSASLGDNILKFLSSFQQKLTLVLFLQILFRNFFFILLLCVTNIHRKSHVAIVGFSILIALLPTVFTDPKIVFAEGSFKLPSSTIILQLVLTILKTFLCRLIHLPGDTPLKTKLKSS